MRRAFLLVLSVLLISVGQSAENFEEEHRRTVAANPPGVSFTLSLADGRTGFRIGERIPIRLTFQSDRKGAYTIDGATYDRSGRLHIETYRVSPADGVVDPAGDYFLSGVVPSFMGGLRSYFDPGSKPVDLEFDLNEWLRFDSRGRYRVYATSRRLSVNENESADSGDRSRPRPLVSSNIIDLEIFRRDERWERQTIDLALAELSACKTPESPMSALGLPTPLPFEDEKKYRRAAATLRYVGSNAAVDAIFRAFGQCDGKFDFQLTLGLVGAVDRTYVRTKLDAAITDPNLGIEAHDLTLMAVLDGAEQTDWQIPELLTDPRSPPPWLLEKLETRHAQHKARLQEHARKLALALPSKNPWAARFSLQAVEAFSPEDAQKLAHLAEPKVPTAAEWAALPPAEQLGWLISPDSWERLKKDELLPELLVIAETDPTGLKLDSSGIVESLRWKTAVERLHELSPAKAQEIIIKQVIHPMTVLHGWSTLLDLLPSSLPELSEPLAANLERDPVRISHLIARFADDTVYGRVEAVYQRREGGWPCDAAESLLGYLLRARPATGVEHIRRAMQSREQTGCYRFLLSTLRRQYKGAELIELAREFLSDADAEVAADAKRVLAAASTPQAPK